MTDAVSLSWHLTVTASGRFACPSEVVGEALPAPVPGTLASALAAAGRWQAGTPLRGHDRDVWYRAALPAALGQAAGLHDLDLAGLATVAEIFVDDRLVLRSANAFRRHVLTLDLAGATSLAIVFRALTPRLAAKGPRARWKAPMIPDQGLRLIRTPLIGQMPGWTSPVDAIGPFGRVALRPQRPFTLVDLNSELRDGVGIIKVVIRLNHGRDILLRSGGNVAQFSRFDDIYSAYLLLDAPPLWWPHTHGEPALHPVELLVDGVRFDLGRIGFRRIERIDDRPFALRINGEPVFCRGAVWTSADPVGLSSSRTAVEPFLRQAVAAGMNMIRVSGTMVPPGRVFYDVCDELGLMVWQDFPFANFDYPVQDADFRAEVEAEAADLLGEIGASPSLTVLCGGSEVLQQAAMMGLPVERWPGPLFDEILPAIAARRRSDVPYVSNSPSGGALPFVPNSGVGHYYGVGAYMRPLGDARRAEVGFAGECLAFSNVPDQGHLDRHLSHVPPHDPRWKATIPRDLAASWDFEDVREHYLRELFGVDPARLRREDLLLWLDLSRIATGVVMAETFAEWRRQRSPTAGALVWTLQDLMPGAGWGLLTAEGEPKPAFHILARVLQPLQVLLTDEGTNGLAIHLINETAEPRAVRLDLLCLKDSRTPVIRRSRDLTLPARANLEVSAYELLGAFFDISYAYRFGPPGHDVTIARLIDSASGETLSEAIHYPLGLGYPRPTPTLAASVDVADTGTTLTLHADVFVPHVIVTLERHRCDTNFLPLVPGEARILRLEGHGPVTGSVALPGGRAAIHLSG